VFPSKRKSVADVHADRDVETGRRKIKEERHRILSD
jgi:hypothetical protein